MSVDQYIKQENETVKRRESSLKEVLANATMQNDEDLQSSEALFSIDLSDVDRIGEERDHETEESAEFKGLKKMKNLFD